MTELFELSKLEKKRGEAERRKRKLAAILPFRSFSSLRSLVVCILSADFLCPVKEQASGKLLFDLAIQQIPET
jgi:hypothetical protein